MVDILPVGLSWAEFLFIFLCFGALVAIAIAAIGYLVIFLTRKKSSTRRERDDDDIEGAAG